MILPSSKIKIKSIFKHSVVVNIIIVASITVFIKLVGFYKEMEIGQVFGLSEILDSFLIATLLPGFVNNVFMVSFQNLFIPNYIIEQKEGGSEANFQTTSFLITSILSIVLIFIVYLVTDFFLEDFYKGHSASYYKLIRTQFYIILPCIITWSNSYLLAGILEIKGLFKYSSLYPLFTSIITILFLFFFKDKLGYYVLAYGLLLGSICEFIYLALVAFTNRLILIGKLDFSSPNICVVLKQFPMKVGSGFLSGSTNFINQFYAAQLVIGSLATFNYALKLPSFLIAILTIAIGNVILPYFTRVVMENKDKGYETLQKILIYIFSITSFVVIILCFFSEFIISTLFERDNFTHMDTLKVSKIQIILLVQVPFYISSIIIIKFLTSINKNVFMLYASIFNLVFSIIFNFLFVKYIGIYGVAIATSLVVIVNFILLFGMVLSQKKQYDKNN